MSFSEQSSDGFYTTNPYSYALETTRAIASDEYYTTKNNTIDGLSNNYPLTYNIFNELAHTGNEAKSRNFSGNVGIDIDILKGLKLQTLFGSAMLILLTINGRTNVLIISLVFVDMIMVR